MFPSNREIWKRIDGYANYEISNFGRVSNATTERILKPNPVGGGYLAVGLNKEGRRKTHPIHKLVAHEWLDNPDNKRCVDHIDGDKTNNHWENLRWATHSENGMNRKKGNTANTYKGVHFYKPKGKYVAYFTINRHRQHLGYFECEREAAEAYNAAATEHFGAFAKLNEFQD